jgi:hypothetical protein
MRCKFILNTISIFCLASVAANYTGIWKIILWQPHSSANNYCIKNGADQSWINIMKTLGIFWIWGTSSSHNQSLLHFVFSSFSPCQLSSILRSPAPSTKEIMPMGMMPIWPQPKMPAAVQYQSGDLNSWNKLIYFLNDKKNHKNFSNSWRYIFKIKKYPIY